MKDIFSGAESWKAEKKRMIMDRQVEKDVQEEVFDAGVLDKNQAEAYIRIEDMEAQEVAAFLWLVKDTHPDLELPDDEISALSGAYNLIDAGSTLSWSNTDSLYSLKGYLERANMMQPEVISYYCELLVAYADVTSIPILLEFLKDKSLYENEYGQANIIPRVIVALQNVIVNARHQHEIPTWVETIAKDIASVAKDNPYRHDLECVLARTGTETAEEYFHNEHNGHMLDETTSKELIQQPGEPEQPNVSWPTDHRFYRDVIDSWDDIAEYDDEGEYETPLFDGEGLRVSETRFLRTDTMKDVDCYAATIDFTPRNISHYSPEHRTEFLLAGINDFKQVLAMINDGTLPNIVAFNGFTNKEMAKASLILGFELEQDTGSEYYYRVTGNREDIRGRIEKIEKKMLRGQPLLKKMEQRLERDRRRDEYGEDQDVVFSH